MMCHGVESFPFNVGGQHPGVSSCALEDSTSQDDPPELLERDAVRLDLQVAEHWPRLLSPRPLFPTSYLTNSLAAPFHTRMNPRIRHDL